MARLGDSSRNAPGPGDLTRHGPHAAPSREYEAARVYEPERAAWDVFDDGGLERPGEDEGW